ncbi:MAG: sigma-70 family RNA polymerase sigma factor [Lachnospiraceae bacterium]|nr:sigma-70 family RNA polymerase sigma factor [Lachnospiraceae bacterium]
MNIIKRIAKGENRALEELFLLYKEKVFRMALAILGDQFLAEDVVQETFLRVQQNAKSYQFRNSEREWIMTIAHNIAIDVLRKRKKEIIQEEIISYREMSDAVSDCDNDIGFLQLIEPLNEPDRQIVSLHLISGLKHREIAHILNMSVSAVKKRYERAIKRIAHEMEGHS